MRVLCLFCSALDVMLLALGGGGQAFPEKKRLWSLFGVFCFVSFGCVDGVASFIFIEAGVYVCLLQISSFVCGCCVSNSTLLTNRYGIDAVQFWNEHNGTARPRRYARTQNTYKSVFHRLHCVNLGHGGRGTSHSRDRYDSRLLAKREEMRG